MTATPPPATPPPAPQVPEPADGAATQAASAAETATGPDTPADTAAATPASTPAGGGERPPLRRSSTDRVLGGVCGGLAAYSGVESLLWRVGFIALALTGPGVPVYLLLWILVPSDPAGPDDAATRFGDRLRKGLTPSR